VTYFAHTRLQNEQERIQPFEQSLMLVRKDVPAMVVCAVELCKRSDVIQRGEQITDLVRIVGEIIQLSLASAPYRVRESERPTVNLVVHA
jgi:hypothetical protein